MPDGDGHRRRCIAVLLAGGVGRRVGGEVPKQLHTVAGHTVLEHSLAVFDRSPDVDEIVVVISPDHRGAAENIVRAGAFTKVTAVVDGGANRDESSRHALVAIGDRDADVLMHDAARPVVDPATVHACVAALATDEAVVVAVPVSDTILEVEGDLVVDVPHRVRFWRAQTPQGFRLATLRRAYELAAAEPGFEASDNCGVVRRFLPDVPIRVVLGRETNIKVTTPTDLLVAAVLLRGDTEDV